jgi:hypothetical protein
VQIALSKTSLDGGAGEAVAALVDRNIVRAEAVQAGEDVVVYLELARDVDGTALSIRRLESPRLQGGDAWTAIELSRPAEAEGRIARTLAAIDGVAAPDLSSCSVEFDSALRHELGSQDLSLAMAPGGRIVGPTLRAAMRRLVAISPDKVVMFEDGTSLPVTSDLELEFALARAGEVRGYLGLLRALVAELEPATLRTSALRGLIAPRIGAERFDSALGRADAAQAACRLASAR